MASDPRRFIKVAFDMPRHPNYAHLNKAQKFMIIEAWLHCAEFRTDGFVARHIWNKMGTKRDRIAVESARGISVLADGSGIFFDDYLDHQTSRTEIEELEERRRSAGKKGGSARAERAKQNAGTSQAHGVAPAKAHSNDFQAEEEREEEVESTDVLSNAPAGANTLQKLEPVDKLETLFAEFWSAYPLKRGKPKARIAFRNAVKRAAPVAIIVGARNYRDDPNRSDEFTKWPQGWLNDDRWNDGPLPDKISMRNASSISRADIARSTLQLGYFDTNDDDNGMMALG